MSAMPNYVPLAIPYRGLHILIYVRTEDQTTGSAEIMEEGVPLATIAPSPFPDFKTGEKVMTERAKAWVDEHLGQGSAI